MPLDYEYQAIRLPARLDRSATQTVLTLHAKYGGWELARLRLFADGSRKVMLRRLHERRARPPFAT